MKVVIKRACYGWGKDTPSPRDREYTIQNVGGEPFLSSAVGTVEEIYEFLTNRGIEMTELEIIDKGETRVEKDVIQFIRVLQLVV